VEYLAVDVETANADSASICQVGVARLRDGDIVQSWSSLVDPEDYFDAMNVSIHAIGPEDVDGAPTFAGVLPTVREFLAGQIVVHHMPFDRIALGRAAARYGLEPISASWLDSARVARRAWTRFAQRGYALKNLAREFAIPLQHHDAASDAAAAGLVVARAVEESGLSVVEWLTRSRQSAAASITRTGDPEGHLVGDSIVFTGKLSLVRREAADLAAKSGANVANSVSRSTTILVVGVQDLRRTNGRSKSSKHRKAEALKQAGHPISIIGEDDFLDLVELDRA